MRKPSDDERGAAHSQKRRRLTIMRQTQDVPAQMKPIAG